MGSSRKPNSFTKPLLYVSYNLFGYGILGQGAQRREPNRGVVARIGEDPLSIAFIVESAVSRNDVAFIATLFVY